MCFFLSLQRKKTTLCLLLEVGRPCCWTVCGRSTPSWHCPALLSGAQWAMTRWPRLASLPPSKVGTIFSPPTCYSSYSLLVSSTLQCVCISLWLMTWQFCNWSDCGFDKCWRFLQRKDLQHHQTLALHCRADHKQIMQFSFAAPSSNLLRHCNNHQMLSDAYTVQTIKNTKWVSRCTCWPCSYCSYVFWNNIRDYCFS